MLLFISFLFGKVIASLNLSCTLYYRFSFADNTNTVNAYGQTVLLVLMLLVVNHFIGINHLYFYIGKKMALS